MLPKINGARRVRYKADELYIMLKEDAKSIFINMLDLDVYADDTIVIISGADKNGLGVCASSDVLQDGSVEIMALFDEGQGEPNAEEIWELYDFSPIHIALADMAVNCSGITDDDYRKFLKNVVEPTNLDFYEFLAVSIAAKHQLDVRSAISILYNGFNDYSEAVNDTYHKVKSFSEWGAGEEGPGVINGQSRTPGARPIGLGFLQKDIIYLFNAIHSPNWHDVPYIKLFAENGELII